MIKYNIQALQSEFDTLLEKIEVLPQTHRLLIFILTFAVISNIFYFFIFEPEYQTYQRAVKNYQTQVNILTKYKLRTAGTADCLKKSDEMQKALQKAMRALPDKRGIPVMLTNLSQAGCRAGLVFKLFQPEKEIQKQFYTEIPVSIQVEGKYHQIAEFFFQMLQLKTIVNITNVYVQSRQDGQVLEMKCKAVTYVFI